MKPQPRIRKTVKWGGAVVSVVLLVVWIGSGWWDIQLRNHDGDFGGIRAGGAFVFFEWDDFQRASGHERMGGFLQQLLCFRVLSVQRVQWPFQWWIQWGLRGYFWRLFIPLWIPAMLPWMTTAIAWRLDTLARRRANSNLCPKCSYPRAGLAPSAVCPECGAAAPVAGAPERRG